ncbi:hypothetical protein [Aquipuribacter nitratireducens]|uniref:Carboxypeptidase regulatory-like domain-containing protein n=1 Tax=Aquipuribacter nitratireducens TaxID=650104 RepID=A0ABW0GKZ3_9MICO
MDHDVTSAARAGDGDPAELHAELRRMWEALDAPPDGLVDRVRFALQADALAGDLDLELMRLQQEGLAVAAARGDDVRTVTFGSRALTVMLAISEVTGGHRVDGWVAPGGKRRLEVRTSAGTNLTACDESGRFTLDVVPPGHLQLVLASDDEGGPGQASEDPRVLAGVVTPALTL